MRKRDKQRLARKIKAINRILFYNGMRQLDSANWCLSNGIDGTDSLGLGTAWIEYALKELKKLKKEYGVK